MKAFYHTSTRVVGLALLAGLWVAACAPSNNNSSGSGGAKGGTSSSSSSSKTGGTTGTSSSQTGGNTKSSSGGTTGTSSSQTGGDTSSSSGGTTSTSSSQTGGDTSTGTTTAVGGTGGGDSSSSTSSSGGTGGGDSSSAGGGGTTAAGTGCQTIWDWEGTTVDSWAADTDVTLSVSTTQKVTGSQSLKATIPALTSSAATDGGTAATEAKRSISVTPPAATSNMWPGATVTVQVWIPAGTTGLWMHLYTQSNNWANWNDATVGTPTAGAWTALTFTVPAATTVFPGGINRFGIQLGVSGGGSFAGGDIFIDSITVCGGTQTCSGTGSGSFDFETAGATDGWAFKGDTTVTDTPVTQSTTQHYGATGTGSLKAALTAIPVAPSATGWTSRLVELANPKAYCGQTVTFHVSADNVTGLNVQPYASANNWSWFAGTGVTLTAINSWTAVTFTLPATINFLGLQAFGLQLSNTSTTATYTGNVYIDGVTWQ